MRFTHTRVLQVQKYHEAGAKLMAADSLGWTPLHHASRFGKYEVVEYIVGHCECIDYII